MINKKNMKLNKKDFPKWIIELDRDILEPYRKLAIQQEFFLQLQNGTLPDKLLERYLLDTQWAVLDFARIADDMAKRAPSCYKEKMELVAQEEQAHPMLLSETLKSFNLNPSGIILNDGMYQPTPLYELWWIFIQNCANNLPWEEGIAAIMVGVEGLARVQENIVGSALIEEYGLSHKEAAWFIHHGGEEEAEHGNFGLELLSLAINPDDNKMHKKVRELIKQAASPLLFHYPNQLLGISRVMQANNISIKSSATEELSERGIDYNVIPHSKDIKSVEEFALTSKIPLDRIFKTMLLKNSQNTYFLFICPGAERIDFKYLKKYFGTQPTLAKREKVFELTGYEPSAVSPFGTKQKLPVYTDSRLYHGNDVYFGSGTKGFDIQISTLNVLESLQPICL